MSVNCSNKAASIPNILRGGIAKYHFIAALTCLDGCKIRFTEKKLRVKTGEQINRG